MASDAAKQEFSRLELSKAAFDFSDRGISGRDQPGPVDAFLYTERGVYRPGETVQLMAMLRDDGAMALANMPVTLIVKRPDGTEFTRFTHALQASGALYQPIDLPKSSRRGRWSVAAHIDPKAPPVGRVDFSVEDFVPEKLKVELTPDQPILRPGQVNSFAVSADFLYGAPASGLTGRGRHARHRRRPAVPDFAKYRFGSEDERKKFEPPFITLDGAGHRRRPASRASNGAATRSRTRSCRCAPSSRPASSSPAAAAPRATDKTCRCAPATSISASVRPSRAATPREGADDRVRHRRGRRHRQAGRPAGGRIPHRAHRLRLSVVPGRRPLALAVDARRDGCSPPTRWPLKADQPARLRASSTGAHTG